MSSLVDSGIRYFYFTVSGAVRCVSPKPTRVGLIYFRPKSVFKNTQQNVTLINGGASGSVDLQAGQGSTDFQDQATGRCSYSSVKWYI